MNEYIVSIASCSVGRNVEGVDGLCLWWIHIIEVIAGLSYL